MTTEPISRDESLNGSWVELDAFSPSQSPTMRSPAEYRSKPLSLAESVQQLGLISFQVDRILRDAQASASSSSRLSAKSYDLSWSNSPELDRPYSSDLKSPPDCMSEALSDSISIVEAMIMEQEEMQKNTDWFWDWSARPEYFSKEWKMQQPVKRPCLSLRQWASKRGLLSSEVLSLLFLTNILSLLIGAGISYTILMRKSAF